MSFNKKNVIIASIIILGLAVATFFAGFAIKSGGNNSSGGVQVLDTPTELTIIDSSILVWKNVSNAKEFAVFIQNITPNDNINPLIDTAEENNYNLSTKIQTGKSYQIWVIAKSGDANKYKDSGASELIYINPN